MNNKVINLNIVYRGTEHKVSLNCESTLNQLALLLEEMLSLAPYTQKLFITGHTKPLHLANNQTKLADAGIEEGMKLLLVGSTDEAVSPFQHNTKIEDTTVIGFEQEEERANKRAKVEATTYPTSSPYFGNFEVLPQFSTPPSSQAMNLLLKVAHDPGIVAIMKKHNWKVGTLKEMPPEGLVGIDSVCILGYNQNQGQAIALRLRTDDMKGFRHYNVIKSTMLHELTHIIWNDHDDNFHKLLRQLNKESEELDWTKTKGHVLGTAEDIPRNPLAPVLKIPSPRDLMETTTPAKESGKKVESSVPAVPPQNPQPRLTLRPTESQTRPKSENVPTENPKRVNPPQKPEVVNKPKPVVASPSASTWSCPTCTFENSYSRTSCELCSTSKGAPTSQPQPQVTPNESGWICNVCTFKNTHFGRTCGMCNSPASATATPTSAAPVLKLRSKDPAIGSDNSQNNDNHNNSTTQAPVNSNSEWGCAVCTWINKFNKSVCEMCNSQRITSN